VPLLLSAWSTVSCLWPSHQHRCPGKSTSSICFYLAVLAGVVCATPTRTGKAVAAGTQFTQCGAGVLVAQGEASILTPSALKSMCHRALQRGGTSTLERAAGNLERLTGSARSSFRDCLCAVCAYGGEVRWWRRNMHPKLHGMSVGASQTVTCIFQCCMHSVCCMVSAPSGNTPRQAA
jgi:hypothetical protein